jgi:hypothetical protein
MNVRFAIFLEEHGMLGSCTGCMSTGANAILDVDEGEVIDHKHRHIHISTLHSQRQLIFNFLFSFKKKR